MNIDDAIREAQVRGDHLVRERQRLQDTPTELGAELARENAVLTYLWWRWLHTDTLPPEDAYFTEDPDGLLKIMKATRIILEG